MRITLPDPCLVILCGPAGCGKSTFARRRFRSTQIVSSDRCRAMLTDTEDAMWASAEAFDLFHKIIEMRLKFRRLTVADSTALGKPARSALRRIARENATPAILIVFNVSMQTCLTRDGMRGRRVGRDVIARQIEKLQQAIIDTRTERFDAVYILDEKEMDAVSVRRRKKERKR